MGKLINLNEYITGKEEYATNEKAKEEAEKLAEVINFDEYRNNRTKEEAEKLAEERMQAYTDFLAIIENLKKMDNEKEMNRILAEIAKAIFRKLTHKQALDVIKHYEEKFSD